jgi:hypothetical protein
VRMQLCPRFAVDPAVQMIAHYYHMSCQDEWMERLCMDRACAAPPKVSPWQAS